MNNRFIKIMALVASSVSFVSGCGDNSTFETPNTDTVTNSGIISQKNFSLLTADVFPAVIDGTTGVFTQTDVELTAYIGDRNNQSLTDAHTIYFVPEYGLVNPSSCVTTEGTCSVTWSAIKRPDPAGPTADGLVTIAAYSAGEEGFTDTNGNSVFDDNDAGFEDLEEPYVDVDESFSYTSGDKIIDVVSTNDPTGVNGVHDIADGFFNGTGCSHTSLCGTATSIAVFDRVTMSIISDAILSRTIGGNVAGLAGSGLELQNNDADDLPIATDGPYTFANTIEDGQTYTVTVLTQPTGPNQMCTVANASGTVSANVTNVDVTCATNTYTVGGTVTGTIPGGENLIILNNSVDALTITAAGNFEFNTAIADGSAYNVIVDTQPASRTCTVSNGTGTVSGANITSVTIDCIP